jgi:hypothetical protein
MPIKGYNFAPSMFLLELSTQCNFALECERRLRDAAPAWFTKATNEQVAGSRAPRDIMIDCTGFLSAAGVLSKLLFSGRRSNRRIVHRCKRLQELLDFNENDLPLLRNLSVRNSFEHIDERLDNTLHQLKQGSFVPISVSEAAPAPGATVLKRFDPKRLEISILDEEISLADCASEIANIKARIDPAFQKLTGSEFKLWP